MIDNQENQSSSSRSLLIRALLRLLSWVLFPFRLLRKVLVLSWRFFRWTLSKIFAGGRLFLRWFSNGFLLFIYSTRRLFTIGTTVATFAAIYIWLFFGWQTEGDATGLYLVPALVLAILFSMHVIPREKESGTLEVFFSLPVKRYRLVVWHLVTIAIWLFIILLIPTIFLAPVHEEIGVNMLLIRVYPSLLCISTLTLWLSTYTRSGPAAGFISGLICFLHLFQIRAFGPIQLFSSPYLPSSAKWGIGQVLLLVVLCVLLLYLTNGRLKKSELWFR